MLRGRSCGTVPLVPRVAGNLLFRIEFGERRRLRPLTPGRRSLGPLPSREARRKGRAVDFAG